MDASLASLGLNTRTTAGEFWLNLPYSPPAIHVPMSLFVEHRMSADCNYVPDFKLRLSLCSCDVRGLQAHPHSVIDGINLHFLHRIHCPVLTARLHSKVHMYVNDCSSRLKADIVRFQCHCSSTGFTRASASGMSI